MGKIFYEIGFSDKSYDGLSFGEDSTDEHLKYNIQKHKPSIENDKIVWELHDTPVVRNMLDMWETTIRIPHLLWCMSKISESEFLPTEKDYMLNWEYIPLIPKEMNPYQLTAEDAATFERGEKQFGDLYIPYGMLYNTINDASENWQHLEHRKTLDNLHKGPPLLLTTTGFAVNFKLRRVQKPQHGFNKWQLEWLNEHKDELSELGYDLDDSMCFIGDYKIGSLVTDPIDAREIISKNPYMCRHSIVSEDQHKK